MPDSRNGRRFKYNGTDIARDIIQRPVGPEGSPSVTGEQVHICVSPEQGKMGGHPSDMVWADRGGYATRQSKTLCNRLFRAPQSRYNRISGRKIGRKTV